MDFLKTPNLPKNGGTALIDERCSTEFINSLEDLGLELIPVKPCGSLYEAVSSHPDMLFHDLGEGYLIYAPGADLSELDKLKKKGFTLIEGSSRLTAKYPADICYNAARVGNFVFHNFKYSDRTLLSEIEKRNLTKVQVEQGYTKCSICVVDENSIITADEGIHKAAVNNGICSLLVPPQKNIRLKGLEYGFIGGSSGKVSEDGLLIYGNAENLTEWDKIKSFTEERGVDIVSLGNGDVEDLGSILVITEK